ncbi:hypothetical protein GEV33_007512 [Tenebrio molitor]|uniref:Uncharacterized protein n=1 Tax=Tenebrio molitor TaxID=7067 RepID=A0A8J6HIE6_TENMO|nr:hypothetical protein GEV33_007512 [Tenebrio molitor]
MFCAPACGQSVVVVKTLWGLTIGRTWCRSGGDDEVQRRRYRRGEEALADHLRRHGYIAQQARVIGNSRGGDPIPGTYANGSVGKEDLWPPVIIVSIVQRNLRESRHPEQISRLDQFWVVGDSCQFRCSTGRKTPGKYDKRVLRDHREGVGILPKNLSVDEIRPIKLSANCNDMIYDWLRRRLSQHVDASAAAKS